jgi:hypothetical protein
MEKSKSSVRGLNEKAASGKYRTDARPSGPSVIQSGKKESRKVAVREDINTDYAEEAEDFFYGKGM